MKPVARRASMRWWSLARRVDDLPLPIDGGWLASRVGELIAAHGEDADVWRFLLDSVKFGSEEVRGDDLPSVGQNWIWLRSGG